MNPMNNPLKSTKSVLDTVSCKNLIVIYMPRKGKLFSRCRGKSQDNCVRDPICIYTNGQKYKYCRLSRKYILDKTDKITKDRITKEKVASLSIRRSNTTAKRKIGKFFKNTTFKRRAKYLSQICQDSNLCLDHQSQLAKKNGFVPQCSPLVDGHQH